MAKCKLDIKKDIVSTIRDRIITSDLINIFSPPGETSISAEINFKGTQNYSKIEALAYSLNRDFGPVVKIHRSSGSFFVDPEDSVVDKYYEAYLQKQNQIEQEKIEKEIASEKLRIQNAIKRVDDFIADVNSKEFTNKGALQIYIKQKSNPGLYKIFQDSEGKFTIALNPMYDNNKEYVGLAFKGCK